MAALEFWRKNIAAEEKRRLEGVDAADKDFGKQGYRRSRLAV
jgi:hypothetical protein